MVVEAQGRAKCKRFLKKIHYLKHKHSISVSKNFVCLVIIAISYCCSCNEQFKWIIFLHVQCSTVYFLLELLHPFLSVTESYEKRMCTNHSSENFTNEEAARSQKYKNIQLPTISIIEQAPF